MKTPTSFGLGLLLLCNCFAAACRQEKPATHSFTSSAPAVASEIANEIVPEDAPVYVCHSTNVKKYHLKQDCGALKRCKHEIVTMTSREAGKIGLELCGHED